MIRSTTITTTTTTANPLTGVETKELRKQLQVLHAVLWCGCVAVWCGVADGDDDDDDDKATSGI